jgi:hypothetical protein
LYASVKDAYAIRSIVVHGAATKSRKKDFRVSSERLDEILRRILLTFLTTQSRLVIFELGTDEFERVF